MSKTIEVSEEVYNKLKENMDFIMEARQDMKKEYYDLSYDEDLEEYLKENYQPELEEECEEMIEDRFGDYQPNINDVIRMLLNEDLGKLELIKQFKENPDEFIIEGLPSHMQASSILRLL